MTMENNPEDETAGTREVPFCKELYIEKEDFMEGSSQEVFPPDSLATRCAPKGPTSLQNALAAKRMSRATSLRFMPRRPAVEERLGHPESNAK